jgi:CHAT domain-containing protein
LLARLSELDPQAALLQGRLGRDPLEIVARLADDEIVLEFALARGRLQVFSIERSGVAAVRDVADERQVHELIDRLRFLLGKGVLGEHHHERFGGFNARATRHYLEQLHRVLLQPVADRIEGRRVRIVPHGVLHGLPFHALERDGVPLIERAAVSYAPSLAVIRLLGERPRRRAAAPPLVLGVADDAAPQIAAEVEVLSRILPSALLKTGAEATRDAVRSGNHDRPLIHVACHGYYTDTGGAEAGLRLGDAWLQLSDIYALSATAPLVVLSGCETGRGTVHAGDEWIGLVSGFLQAGANSVVAALWELHDASAADLMEQFYRGLVEGRSVAEAMAQAQRRARAIDPSPIRWAPFSVVGDPDLRLSKDVAK